MSKPKPDYRSKVAAIFGELVGERAEPVCNGLCVPTGSNAIATAMRRDSDIPKEHADDIGFHLSD